MLPGKSLDSIVLLKCIHFRCLIIKVDFQVDIRWVLTMDPLPLSQEVLLQLLWLLPYCINTNPAEIIAWMTDVFNSIIPTDPAIEMHVRNIFNQVYAALNHISVMPTITDAMRSTIRLLMNGLVPP
jgi:enhancer of mRNA-decapping protein 4